MFLDAQTTFFLTIWISGKQFRFRGLGAGQKIFRRYILQKILGRGGMGVVWLAEDEDLERLVALKVLPETLCHDHASLEALKRETKLGLHLAHPNIVRIYDFQRDDNAAAISMEYVDGATFSEVRTTKPTHVFDPADLHTYIEALCDALHYAHTRERIVHRDLKPRNLMLNSQGELENCRLRHLPQHQRIHDHVDGEAGVGRQPSLHKSSAMGWRTAYSHWTTSIRSARLCTSS